MQEVRRIGITGGFGTGKSTVAGLLRTFLKTEFINADFVCQQLLEPEEKGWIGLKKILGDKFFQADGSLDRTLFRRVLFKDIQIRMQVNELLHPLAFKLVVEQMESFEKNNRNLKNILVEVPLLYEAGWEEIFHRVIVVYAESAICINRIVERDGVDNDEAEAAFSVQMPLFKKVLKADHVINNSGNMSDVYLQVSRLAKELRSI